jgi:hypothetical protein
MTLQATGPISLGNVRAELGRAAGTSISLGETAVRNLAGVASGLIRLSNLYGKSSVAFTPAGGLSSGSPVMLSDWAAGAGQALITIQCTQSAVWTWSGAGGPGSYVSVVSGGNSTAITFSLSNIDYVIRQSFWTVSGTAGGITRHWQVELLHEGYA